MRNWHLAVTLVCLLVVCLWLQFSWDFSKLINFNSFAITALGVGLALLIAGFSISDTQKTLAEIRKIEKIDDRIHTLLYINEVVKKHGLPACEKLAKSHKDNLLQKGLRMLADNLALELDLAETLNAEIESIKLRHKRLLNILQFGASVSPGVGLIGTLVGLTLSGHENALNHAILTTLYGALLSNFFFLPLHELIKNRIEELNVLNNLTVAGLIKIREGVHSIVLKEHLSGFAKYCQESV
ncbi:MAG: MotA/TolQ/ExbB proton channel family protein [Deltaproteobacteria bacterium]|nr:MotA/TolQ/ExbB proton channel family protein [Deltaproteobacteria bacterium]